LSSAFAGGKSVQFAPVRSFLLIQGIPGGSDKRIHRMSPPDDGRRRQDALPPVTQ